MKAFHNRTQISAAFGDGLVSIVDFLREKFRSTTLHQKIDSAAIKVGKLINLEVCVLPLSRKLVKSVDFH